MEIALPVPLVLLLPIIAIAGLVIAIGARDRARTLGQRFADFQNARRRSGNVSAARRRPRRAPVTASALA